ncbi:MAG: hypothetical protein IJ678_00695 [Kiritimatiellae bacterium]|nr:hypothetical protein [Kiritimatiellia bacterium]
MQDEKETTVWVPLPDSAPPETPTAAGKLAPETLADVLRDMRDWASNDMHRKRPRVTRWAARIEAAAERECRAREDAAADYALKRGEEIHADRCKNCVARDQVLRDITKMVGNAAAMREALERILAIEGYGAPWIEAKCIAQKALEGKQCTPPVAQERPKIEQPGNAAAMREALQGAHDTLRLVWEHAADELVREWLGLPKKEGGSHA